MTKDSKDLGIYEKLDETNRVANIIKQKINF